jgi:hypothetical protein
MFGRAGVFLSFIHCSSFAPVYPLFSVQADLALQVVQVVGAHYAADKPNGSDHSCPFFIFFFLCSAGPVLQCVGRARCALPYASCTAAVPLVPALA